MTVKLLNISATICRTSN